MAAPAPSASPSAPAQLENATIRQRVADNKGTNDKPKQRRKSALSEADAAENEISSNLALEIEKYNHNRRLFLIGLHVLNVVAMLLLTGICYILIQYLEGFSLHPDRAELSDYNVHMVCTVLGFVVCPIYAVLIFRIFRNVKYSTLTTFHVIFLMFMSFFAMYGVKISYESHHVYGRVHLYSLHGWLGVGLSGILFFCIISGNWIYLSPTQLPFMVLCHKIVGMAMILIAGSCAVSGILTRSQHLIRRLRINDEEAIGLPSRVIILNTLGMMIVLFIILAKWLLTDHRFRRRPNPEHANDEDSMATGLLRYLATADDSVILPDEAERSWTEFEKLLTDDDESVTLNPLEKGPQLPPTRLPKPVNSELSILDLISRK